MSTLTLCIIGSATGAYIIWGYQTLKKGAKSEEGPTFASMLLWSIIDMIMWHSTRRAHNDQTLIATYTILTVVLTIILIVKKRYGWKKTDWVVAGTAFTCLIVSYITPPVAAVTTGALSISIAGIPNLIALSQIKKKPSNLLYLTVFFFLTGPILVVTTLYSGNADFKEYIYPSIAILYWFTGLSIVLYKHQKLKNPVIFS